MFNHCFSSQKSNSGHKSKDIPSGKKKGQNGFAAFINSTPNRRLNQANSKSKDNGSLDKTLSNFGLSNIDPQFLNPSLLHNGFMLDREESVKQHSKPPITKMDSLSKYESLDLPQMPGLGRKKMNSRDEYEFLTVRPTSRTTKTPNINLPDDISLGSSPPTLPPPSGDIPPFILHQMQYTSKLKNNDKELPSIIGRNDKIGNRPAFKKPLGKPRPPFSPQVKHHISSFEKPLRPKKGVAGQQENNPILRLFQNVQKKSSSLTDIFSPKSWFKESNQVAKNRNSGPNRQMNRNSQNFNRRMSPARLPNRQRNRNKRPPIKMVEGNFHHPANYKYERPGFQKGRDEKSTPDEVLKENQFFTRKLDKSKESGNIKNNILPPFDIDTSESMQSTVVLNSPFGDARKPNMPFNPNVLANEAPTVESQKMQLQNMLEAEQLAAMIEALADQKVMAESMKIKQFETLNQGIAANPTFVNNTKMSSTTSVALGARPTNKELLGIPGQTMSPITNKRKSSYGQGFDPSGIQPEAGFKPIVVGEVQSMPSLAFSVLDSMPDEYLDQQSSHTIPRDISGTMQQQSSDSSQFQISQPLISSEQLSNRRISIHNPQTSKESIQVN